MSLTLRFMLCHGNQTRFLEHDSHGVTLPPENLQWFLLSIEARVDIASYTLSTFGISSHCFSTHPHRHLPYSTDYFVALYFRSISLSYFFFLLFGATPTAYGSSQARGQIGATAVTAMPDLSRVCDLHHSSWQRKILNPLSEARDRTFIPMDTSRIVSPAPQRALLSHMYV